MTVNSKPRLKPKIIGIVRDPLWKSEAKSARSSQRLLIAVVTPMRTISEITLAENVLKNAAIIITGTAIEKDAHLKTTLANIVSAIEGL